MGMDEDEIRFRFLHGLYQKTNGEHILEKLDPGEIIKTNGLEDVEENMVIKEVTYLNKEGLIGGDFADGKILPAYVSSTNWGIETVEQIMDESLSIFLEKTEGQTKNDIQTIQQEESTPKRYLNLWEYASQNSQFLSILKEKIARLISDPGF